MRDARPTRGVRANDRIDCLKKNGGAGIAQAATVFGPMLLEAGMSEALLHRILVDTPRRFLAFVPKV